MKQIPDMPKFILKLLSVYPTSLLLDCLNELNLIRKPRIPDIEDERPKRDIFSWDDGISKYLVYMLIVGIVAYIILIVFEAGSVRMIKQLIFPHLKRRYPNNDSSSDDDVLVEKQRIDRMDAKELKTQTMVMRNVSKFYGSLCAVNKQSIVIKR